jgi:monoamine oxidase
MLDEFAGQAAGRARKSDLTIIGAGIAGLTIALTLIERARAENLPLPRIEILEAGDRPGGRAKSIAIAGHGVNTGGQWLHDMSGNPFYLWLKNRYRDLTYSEDHVARDIVMTDDGLQPPEFYSEQFDVLTAAYLKFKETHPDEDISLADLVPLVQDSKAPMLADYVARNWMAEDDLSLISCDEMFAPGGYGPGGPQVKEGMSAVIGKMADDLRSDGVEIRTATPVFVSEQDAAGVHLLTPGRLFDSSFAAVTASVGVIQSGLITFKPALDARVADYFNMLSMGKMTKLIIPLSDDFMDRRGIQDNTFMSIMNGKYQVFCHARSAGAPVASIFVAGKEAEAFERDPAAAQAFAEKFLDALGCFEGFREAMTGPVIIDRFNTDPYIKGSYSSLRPGGRRSDPLRDGRLFFAGEAFITTDENGKTPSATMSAAWSSGRKAAADIFAVLRPLLQARKPDADIMPGLTPGN